VRCHRTGVAAPTVDRGRRLLLRPDASQHHAPTHGGASRVVHAALRSGGDGPADSARIDAARFGRDASPFSSRRCIARVRARRESCAGAFFFSRRSATRGSGYVAWSGPFSAVEACLGFRPVNLAGNEAGLSSRV
jgi:hypothetical protein